MTEKPMADDLTLSLEAEKLSHMVTDEDLDAFQRVFVALLKNQPNQNQSTKDQKVTEQYADQTTSRQVSICFGI